MMLSNRVTDFTLLHVSGVCGTTLLLHFVVQLFLRQFEWMDLFALWGGVINLWIALPLARHSNNKG